MSSCHICFFFMIMLIIIGIQSGCSISKELYNADHHESSDKSTTPTTTQYQSWPLRYSINRKLLFHGSCSNRDISILQSRDTTSGIPQYIVQIVNTCVAAAVCEPSQVHVHCEWFASARFVNPTTFKRLSYDDCLVNGGKPLKTCQIIRFTYSNSFMYPLKFKSAKFC